MPRVRKIEREPEAPNFYIVDACFLANRYIPRDNVPNPRERARIARSLEWWAEIDAQVKRKKAVVYSPDICIAEAFKVLAKKYYMEGVFRTPVAYNNARSRLSDYIRTPSKTLKAFTRNIKFHDISTSRDIIIALDRFYEIFVKHGLNPSVPDLIILATAKYLTDFYGIPRARLYIVTLDNALWEGSKKCLDIHSAFNPNKDSETAAKVFQG